MGNQNVATKKRTGAKPVGRPSKFTQELADEICEQLTSGLSLRKICQADDMPSVSMVMRWLDSDEQFREQYARAREAQADVIFDEMLEIADECRIGKKTKKTGNVLEVSTGDMVERSRLMIDARKWVLARMSPKKYGEKVTQEHTGSIDSSITVIKRVIVDPKENGNPND